MTSQVVGIDVSKDKLDVALLNGEHLKQAIFDNDEIGHRKLMRWLKKRGATQAHVCLEATGRYGDAVALTLHDEGYAVSVVNPARIKAYGQSHLQRNKTDREDAKLIAHFCATQHPHLWQPPSPAARELQALTHHLQALKEDRVREKNRLQAGGTSQTVHQTIEAHIVFLDGQIAELEQRTHELIDDDPDLRNKRDLLTSIPGIGDTTAAGFLAEVPDVDRFDSAAQLAAYAGLTPRIYTSGSSVHRPGRLVKTGNRRFRTLFYFPAITAIQHNAIVQPLVERLRAAGKKRMVIIGAVMRKLVHLAFGILKHGQPFDPNYLVNVQDTA